MIGALALFAQLSIVAHAPDTVAACEAIDISVTVSATGPVAPQVMPPSLAPFEILRSSIVPHLTYGAGSQGEIMAEFRYVLATERSGVYTLPPFEARLGGEVVRSRPLRIVVEPSYTNERVPTIVARARVDTSLDVNFRALTSPETVYVGQQANYEVAVFLNESVRDRLRRNPTFYPPDMQSMLAYDVPSMQGAAPRRRVGSRCFDALVYQRALFPLLPGRFSIPPAQLSYSLALSASFFSREESRELQTDSTVLVVVDPPLAARPRDFSGAVGDLRLAESLDTTAGRVGDPMLLTIRVAGTGNVKLFPRPALDVPWATLVPAEERVQVDSAARRVRGVKEFDWVLTPKVAGELDLPPVRYSYFNPARRQYEVAAAGATRVHIAAGTLAATDTSAPRPVLALRAVYEGPLSIPPQQQPLFWMLLAAAPLPALTLHWRDRRRRGSRASSALATLRAFARGGSGAEDPSRIRRAFALALAERLHIGSETFARPGLVARVLRRTGVSTGVAAEAEEFMRELDHAAFSPDGTLSDDAASRALALYRAVDGEALRPTELAFRPGALALTLLVALGLAAGAHLFAQDDARSAFVHGVSEYYGGRYASAREAFARSALAEPRAAEAWANLGTAAWAAGDTARAVAGWERALRLDPASSDLRDRLDFVRATPLTSAGYVAPVPLPVIVWFAALVWIIAWTCAAAHAARHRRGARRLALAFGMSSIVLALVALELSDRQDERRLGIVRVDTPLSTVPALGGERIGSVGVGEVARITGRQGVWLHVSLDGGRIGWLDATQVIPLESAAAPVD